jgi:hypothetical protein
MTGLIVDDHGGFGESARALLEAEGFAVVGCAADGAAAPLGRAAPGRTAPKEPLYCPITLRWSGRAWVF